MTAPLKLTALHAVSRGLGAHFVDHLGGWHVAGGYAPVAAEVAAIRAGCGLADVSPHGKLQIEGAAAFDVLRAAFGQAPEAVLAGTRGPAGHLVRLRPDLFYLSTPPGREADHAAQLEAAVAAAGVFVTVTDLTHGLADLCLIGPAALEYAPVAVGIAGSPSRSGRAEEPTTAAQGFARLQRRLTGRPRWIATR
jgi:glycine cleavage system aminomethyltransferase T